MRDSFDQETIDKRTAERDALAVRCGARAALEAAINAIDAALPAA